MSERITEWRATLLIGVAIVALAVFLRVYSLTSLPVFADEAIYVRWAQVMKNEPTLRFLPLSDGKQPLFMWSIVPFLSFFDNPLVAGRAVSALTGISSLVGVFLLTHLLFRSKKVSLISSLVYAVAPFAVFFDRMALVDSMLTMFGIWTFIFALIAATRVRVDAAIFAGFSLGGALLTKSPALFYVLLLPLVGVFSKFPKFKNERVVHLLKLSGLLFLAWGIGFAMLNVLRLGPNFHLITSRNQDYVFPINHLWQNPKDPFIFHFDRALEWIKILGTPLVVVLVLTGIAAGLKKYKKEVFFLLAWALGPIMVQAEFAKVFTARYILFSIPALYVLAGVSFLVLSVYFKGQKYAKHFYALILASFVALSLWFNWKLITEPERSPLPRGERSGYLEEWTAGTGIPEVAGFIIREHEKDPAVPIVVGTEGFFGTLPDGLQIYLEKVPDVTVIGVGLGIKKIPDQLLESREAGNKTYLAANSSRLAFPGFDECKKDGSSRIENPNCQRKILADNGFKIVLEVEKAMRPYGFKEFVQHGPRDTFYLLEVR